MKKNIESQEDVTLLVHTFYAKVRENKLLGPVFNNVIKDWTSHLKLLVSFWESNLFFERKYFGNPMHAHIEVDKKVKGIINELYFETWLTLWNETIDELFEGETAEIAKNRAKNMAFFLNKNIFDARNHQPQ